MVLLIESIILIVIFTLIMAPSVMKNPLRQIYNYPPAIIERVKSLGLITEAQEPRSKKVIIKKALAAVVFSFIIAISLIVFNGKKDFLGAFTTGYLLWNIVNWYDAFILDCVWFCHCKRIIIPGTEDMVKEYHNYFFHIIGSLKGMLIGLPVCLLSAGIVVLFYLI